MVTTERVTYRSGEGGIDLAGFVAVPDGPGPHPAVLILRGVAGPEDGYSEIAERLAGWGYLAFLHGWKVRGDDPPDAPVLADLAGAMACLRARPDVDAGRIAVFGFCRGGVHALMAAAAHSDIRLLAIFHGFAFRREEAQPGLQPYDLVSEISVPTLIMHGAEDERAPIDGMRRLEDRARELKKPMEFEYYDGIPHGFAVRTHPGYDAAAADRSFRSARDFIETHMPPARS